MASTETLVAFLNARNSPRGQKETHLSFAHDNNQRIPGRMMIGEDELDRFFELYIDWVDTCGEKICIVEKSTETSPLRVDLDFLYDSSIQKNQHTRAQVEAFVSAYIEEARKYLVFPQLVDIYVSEKKKPTLKKGLMSGGLHILVPSLRTHKYIELKIRENLVKRMAEFFGDLPLVDKKWESVYDKGVAARSANWMLPGAAKSDGLPYLIKYVGYYSNGTLNMVDETPALTVPFLKMMSVRVDSSTATPLTEAAEEYFGNPQQIEAPHNTAISGGRAVTPIRGRPANRGDGNTVRELSPTAVRQRPLTEEEKAYYSAHTMNLASHRYESYDEWVYVGQALWNIHPNDLREIWHEFSSQASRGYTFKDADSKWVSFTHRLDGPRTSKKTLLFLSRTDNPERYAEIERGNVDSLIEQSLSEAEYDVALVVHAKFHDTYCCGHFSKDVWYKFSGQIWTETDKGVDLLLKLSDDIWKLYNRKRIDCLTSLNDLPDCMSKIPDGCATCQAKKKEEQYRRLCKSLKTTVFKNNVMRECRLLFYDTEFINKVNENPHLFAFQNTVFDTEKMVFREGKQEDYMMFSAKFEYDIDKKYTDYADWPEVELFLQQILPEEDVRLYVVKYLASCLSGCNEAQKFHIWTGTGANGKSMLMNLMESAMGDYACKAPIALFTQSRAKAGGASPDQVKLRGKRFVTMSEPDEDYALNTGLIKEYTSGEKITVRDLYAGASSILEFVLRCKFNLGCNDLPRINSTDGGTWRRIIKLQFNSEFRPNPKAGQFQLDETIQQKVRSLTWTRAFMAYLVHMYIENNGCKNLQPPERILAYTSEYREESDAIARFMRDTLRPVAEDEVVVPVRRETLQEAFRTWRSQTEELRVKMQDLMSRIETTYGKYPKGTRAVVGGWRNFQIMEQD